MSHLKKLNECVTIHRDVDLHFLRLLFFDISKGRTMFFYHFYLIENNKIFKKVKVSELQRAGVLLFLLGMAYTPTFWMVSNVHAQKRSASTVKKIQAAAKNKTKKVKTSSPSVQQPTSRKTQIRSLVHSGPCRGRRRAGRYCLGRTIGPRTIRNTMLCPHDQNPVHVKSLIKPWSARRRDSDLRPHMGHYQQKDRIWTCRKCGYSAYAKDFLKAHPKKRMEHVLSRFRLSFTDKETMSLDYQLRALQSSYWVRKRPHLFFIDMYIRFMWIARETKQANLIPKYRKRAIAGLRFAFKRKLYPVRQRAKMAYLLADLYRQSGAFTRALQWLEFSFQFLVKNRKMKRSFEQKKEDRYLGEWILQGQARAGKKDKSLYVLK